MLKAAVKPVYHFVHDLLFQTIDANPFFPKTYQGKAIEKGHISLAHLADPALDVELSNRLEAVGATVKPYHIDVAGYRQYIQETNYPASYYGGGQDPKQNFTEKTLEHYVSLDFMNLGPNSRFVDIAACTSPFFQIVQDRFGVREAYQQDLVYPKGLNDGKIGGYAHELPFEPNSVDAVTLHCSLEHFEGVSDTEFFRTMNRILKPGGRIIVLPFYLAARYVIHVDPVFNALRRHRPQLDEKAELRYCNWYQFFSRHYDPKALQARVLTAMPDVDLTIY
ncbi:MAG: methyltransferase domain-containing protein [Bacteroidota bacterium]